MNIKVASVKKAQLVNPYLTVLLLAPLIQGGISSWIFTLDASSSLAQVSQFVYAGLLALAMILFIGAPMQVRPGLISWFLIALMGALWGLCQVQLIIHQQDFSWSSLGLPLSVIMLCVKPPTRPQVWHSFRIAAWFAVGLTLFTAARDIFFIELHPDQITPSRLLGSLNVFGSRWSGPFSDGLPGASIVGLFVFAVGCTRRGFESVSLCLFGSLLILFTEARSGFLALGVVCIVLIVGHLNLRDTESGWSNSRTGLWANVTWLGLVGISAFLCLLIDPSPNGRVEIWNEYLKLGMTSPVFGLGNVGAQSSQENSSINVGVQSSQEASSIPDVATHGHNVFIDAFARDGMLVAGIYVIFGLTLLFWAIRGMRTRDAAASAIVLAVGIMSMFDVPFHAVFWTFPYAVLVLSGLVARDAVLKSNGRGTSASRLRKTLRRLSDR